MISVSKLKEITYLEQENFSTEEFLLIHRFVEGYLKRITFIALRLHDVQYQTSLELANFAYIGGVFSQIKKVFELLPGNHTLNSISEKHNDFKVFQELFTKYTSSLRNRLLHGGIGKLRDEEVLRYAALIDQRFIKEFEKVLKEEWNASAFDTPKAWGAKRITTSENKIEVAKRLKLGKVKVVDWRLEDVKAKLEENGISLTNN